MTEGNQVIAIGDPFPLPPIKAAALQTGVSLYTINGIPTMIKKQ